MIEIKCRSRESFEAQFRMAENPMFKHVHAVRGRFPHVPVMVVCQPYPIRFYDVRSCPGEVTTNRSGTIATCEVVAR